MSMNIRFPNITAAKESEQINQIKSYLHQLVEQLNWALATLESGIDPANASGAETPFGDISEETFYELKSLLIQSSDTLNAYYDKINQKLEGQYVAQTDFNTYKQENTQSIEKLDTKFVLQTDFDAYKQEVSQRFDTLQQSIDGLDQRIDALEKGGE